MGADKAFLEFGGQTLVDRALTVMAAVCDSVTIVGDPAKFAQYGSSKYGPVVADVFPGCGPLGGIHAALAHSTAELNLMLAVDMPLVSAELLAFLFAAAENTGATITASGCTLEATTRGAQAGLPNDSKKMGTVFLTDCTVRGNSVFGVGACRGATLVMKGGYLGANHENSWKEAGGSVRLER